MKRLLLITALLFAPACGAVLNALPTVIGAVTDAMGILGMIESRADAVLDEMHADDAARAKVHAALVKTRAALTAAQRSAQALDAAGNLDQAGAEEAFEAFKVAYLALLDVVAPLGIVEDRQTLRASPAMTGTMLRVPRPAAFALRVPQ